MSSDKLARIGAPSALFAQKSEMRHKTRSFCGVDHGAKPKLFGVREFEGGGGMDCQVMEETTPLLDTLLPTLRREALNAFSTFASMVGEMANVVVLKIPLRMR